MILYVCHQVSHGRAVRPLQLALRPQFPLSRPVGRGRLRGQDEVLGVPVPVQGERWEEVVEFGAGPRSGQLERPAQQAGVSL